LNKVEKIIAKLEGKEALVVLNELISITNEKIVFSTSFGYEDQVISHFIFENNLPINVFTLDTGRLFPETYSVYNSTLNRYKKPIEVYNPNTIELEKLLTKKGPFSFYDSTENRIECCNIRKVEPLKRALNGFTIWITGIRSEQSPNRKNMPMVEWDNGNQIIKVHPLLNWTLEGVKKFIKQNNIPYNPLHDKGFVSIGCQPCTRAIKDGEDFRAGRWWWEDVNKKECGLHK
jgi:phosphoadenosine phosphosulfate reductase